MDSMNGLTITEDEYQSIKAIQSTLGILGEAFSSEEGTPEALRMVVASLRAAADTLEGAVKRWEASKP